MHVTIRATRRVQPPIHLTGGSYSGTITGDSFQTEIDGALIEVQLTTSVKGKFQATLIVAQDGTSTLTLGKSLLPAWL